MKTETVEARAVKIAAKIMQAAVFREFGEWAKGGDYFGYAMLARRLTEILGEPVDVDESKADEPIFSKTLD